MGTCYSKPQNSTIKRNKNHNRQKRFHLQMGYHSKTIKSYGCIENRTDVLKGDVSFETTMPQEELGAVTLDS